jgi:chloride channel 7
MPKAADDVAVESVTESDDGMIMSEPAPMAPRISGKPFLLIPEVQNSCHSFDYFASAESPGLKLSRNHAWLLTFLAALCVGLVKGGVSWGTSTLRNLRLSEMTTLSERTTSIYASMGIMVAFCLLSGLISAVCVLNLSTAAGGGGIPDIKAYLNGNLLSSFLSFRTLAARLVGVLLVTSCGVMAGPEGPMAHVGMILTTLSLSLLMGSKGINEKDRFDLATVGSGIGIASAFTAPITGTLFALEEAATFWHPELISRTLFGCIVAAVVGEFTSAGFQCEKGELFCVSVWGEFSLTVENFAVTFYRAWEIPLFLVEGTIMGCLGVGLSYIFLLFAKFRRRPWSWRLFDVSLVFTLTTIIFCFATFAGQCQPGSNLPIEGLTISSALCSEDGQFNPIALILLENPTYAIRTLFAAPSTVPGLTLPILLLCFFLASLGLVALCGIPAPVGQFIPLVLCGGLAGRFLGSLGIGSCPGVYALAGSAGLLSGVSRMTVWIVVVMVESSAQIELTIPIVLSVIGAKMTADWLMPEPLYERLMGMKGIRYLPPSDDPIVSRLIDNKSVKSFMTTTVEVVYESETVDRIEILLRQTPFQIFPVLTKGGGSVIGTISRIHLEKLIELVREETSDAEDPHMSIICIPRNGAITVSETAALSKAYYLFTHLGLGMLVVVDENNKLSGILTREDFHTVVHPS